MSDPGEQRDDDGWFVIGIVVVSLFLLAVGFGGFQYSRRLRAARDQAEEARSEAQRQAEQVGKGPRQTGGAGLTAEEARRALIAMVERSDDAVLKSGLAKLRMHKSVAFSPRSVHIGNWHCNLEEGTFVLSVENDKGFTEYEGTFEKPAGGRWRATVTGKK